MTMTDNNAMRQQIQECIQNCLDCHRICLETISHCLQMGGTHAEAAHLQLLMDCAEICQTSANFMMRGSEFHSYTCGICAEICESCARDCERIGGGADAQMKKCAEMCRKCATSCRLMAGPMQ